MQLFRHFIAPFVVLALFIVLTILGLVSGGAGWVALSLLCAWPLFYGVLGWTLRSLKDMYRVVPKQAERSGRAVRGGVPEVLS